MFYIYVYLKVKLKVYFVRLNDGVILTAENAPSVVSNPLYISTYKKEWTKSSILLPRVVYDVFMNTTKITRGEYIKMNIIVKNVGNTTANNVTICYYPPEATIYQSCYINGSSCESFGCWKIDRIRPNENITITLVLAPQKEGINIHEVTLAIGGIVISTKHIKTTVLPTLELKIKKILPIAIVLVLMFGIISKVRNHEN